MPSLTFFFFWLCIAKASVSVLSSPVGSDPCTYGPSYWCASTANAAKCNVSISDCAIYCNNPSEYPSIQNGDICGHTNNFQVVGDDHCTDGPSYWCASTFNAEECNITITDCFIYCNNPSEYPSIQNGDICSCTNSLNSFQVVGENPCTDGPSYWCASTANVAVCGFNITSCTKYCNNSAEYPSIQDGNVCNPPGKSETVGENPCTYGPSYWCASLENADRCSFNITGCATYCNNATMLNYPTLLNSSVCKSLQLGNNNCTQGPTYWCASSANAIQCGVHISNCFKYCAMPQTNGETNTNNFIISQNDICHPPSNPCTYGPSYWCASTQNAHQCHVPIRQCQRIYCNHTGIYPSLAHSNICTPIVGSNPCTWGPSYWCSSEANANQCGMTSESCAIYCNNAESNDLANSTLCN